MLAQFAIPVVYDYLYLVEIITMSSVCREYHQYTVNYWREHSLEITDASIGLGNSRRRIRICTNLDTSTSYELIFNRTKLPPILSLKFSELSSLNFGCSEDITIYIPSRIRCLTMPGWMCPHNLRLDNVEWLKLTHCIQSIHCGSGNAVTVPITRQQLPRLRRLYADCNILTSIGDYPMLEYVRVTGTAHKEGFYVMNDVASNIRHTHLNITNLAMYQANTPHISIITETHIHIHLGACQIHTEIKVKCPDEVLLTGTKEVIVHKLIIDAPQVRILGDEIVINELHVQSHLGWQFRKYKPKLLPSNHSSCILS